MKLEDPEKYQARLAKMKEVNKKNYADPEYRQKMLEHKREMHKIKTADQEWRARRNAYDRARQARKRLEGQQRVGV